MSTSRFMMEFPHKQFCYYLNKNVWRTLRKCWLNPNIVRYKNFYLFFIGHIIQHAALNIFLLDSYGGFYMTWIYAIIWSGGKNVLPYLHWRFIELLVISRFPLCFSFIHGPGWDGNVPSVYTYSYNIAYVIIN